MKAWVVIMASLPVLYITGNIRTATKKMGISGTVFVLYFIIGLVMLLLPEIGVFGEEISIAGAFACLSPLVYLAIKRKYDYRFAVCAIVCGIIYIAIYIIAGTLTFVYLRYVAAAVMSAVALIGYKEKAAFYVPALVGVYCAFEAVFAFAFGLNYVVKLLGCLDILPFCIVTCLTVSYAFKRQRRKIRAAV